MEPLDAAQLAFSGLRGEIDGYVATMVTEQDTRLKAIDRILIDVLGWDRADIQTENRAGTGFVDYALHVGERPRAIVEAKRDGVALGLSGDAGRPYKLNGAMFGAKDARAGLEQAISYCAHKSTELAVLTNGREWVIFRGNRGMDGIPVLDGRGFVFSSLDAIADQFKVFWELLSYDAVSHEVYRPHFLEAEDAPVRSVTFSEPAMRPEEARPIKRDAIYGDVRAVMTRFFTRLTGDDDPEMLSECFVETRESKDADRAIARISEDLVADIQTLDTATGAELTGILRSTIAGDARSFVVLVGTKGAGKSTFIDRFFRSVVPADIKEQLVTATIDLRQHPSDPETVIPWLKRELIATIERGLQASPLEYDDILGMFYDEYTRLKRGPWKHLYEQRSADFRIQFGDMVESMRNEDPDAYVAGLLRHIVGNRKKLPLVVLDNADNFTTEFQEAVYQFARSLHERSPVMVILPITDRTSWQLSDQGALRSFEHESLYLPTPPMQDVLQKRISYLSRRLAADTGEAKRYDTSVGMRLSVEDMGSFVATLEDVFIRKSFVSEWLASLSNNDVRRALQLTSDVVSSPHIKLSTLIGAVVADKRGSIPPHQIRASFIRDKYNVYPTGKHSFVQNLFSLTSDVDSSPLTGVRLLKLLMDAPRDEHTGAYIGIDTVVSYMNGMRVSRTVTLAWLDALLRTGLCRAYDPTIVSVFETKQVELSPSGKRHYLWGVSESDYVNAMAEVTPVTSRATHQALKGLSRKPERKAWFRRIEVFVDYLLDEDHRYISIPGHDAYAGQLLVADELRKLARNSVTIGEDHLTR